MGRKRSVKIRWQISAVAVLAILVVVVAVSAVMRSKAVAAANGGDGKPVAEATINAGPESTLPPLVIKPGDKAIFLGDSWTFGQHIPDYKKGFAYLTIAALGLDGQVLGYPGSGFLNPNKRSEGTYAQRISGLRTDAVKLIVIQGGTNDRDESHFDLPAAVTGTVTAAKKRFPSAQVVLMGPMSPGYPKDPRVPIVDQYISNAAEVAGVHFVDPDAEQWINEVNKDQYMDAATGHPTVAGHALIAKELVATLRGMTAPAN